MYVFPSQGGVGLGREPADDGIPMHLLSSSSLVNQAANLADDVRWGRKVDFTPKVGTVIILLKSMSSLKGHITCSCFKIFLMVFQY